MIGVDSPTSLDLRFRLGPIPVRVGVMFWVIMAVFGYGWSRLMELQGLGNTWINLLVWMACGFVSILVHEMGHALAFRLFGSWATIVLHGFGGVAVSADPPRTAGRRMMVALAGPVAGFALCGIVYGISLPLANVAVNVYLAVAFTFLLWMGLFWNAFNLLPIPPLDGGNVCRELLALLRVPNPDIPAHGVGFVLALLLAIWGGVCVANLLPPDVRRAIPNWAEPGIYMTLWFALFAVNNFQLMQLARRNNRYRYEAPDDYDDDTPPWRRR